MNVLDLLGGWQLKLIISILAFAALFAYHKIEVNKAVTKATTELRLEYSKESFKLKEHSMNAQIELQTKVDKIEKDKNNEIANLKSRVRTLTDSLSSRPNRPEPSGVSSSTGNQESRPGSTGAELYREDGEFLAREAARADEIRIELKGCYKSYDEMRQRLDEFKKQHK